MAAYRTTGPAGSVAPAGLDFWPGARAGKKGCFRATGGFMIELMGRTAVTRGPRWAVASLAVAMGLGFGALPFVQGAEGSAVAVRFGSQVPVGQQPFVELEAREPLAAVRLALTRDDGKIVRRSFPSLRKGQTARVALDGAPGTHRYTGELVASPRGGNPHTSLLDFETQVSEALKLDVDRGRLDLAAGRLWLTASRALAEVEVTVHGAAPGASARTQRHAITHSKAGVALEVTFPGAMTWAASISRPPTPRAFSPACRFCPGPYAFPMKR